MVDWKKKIEKNCAGDLQVDEQLEAGLFVQPAGGTARVVGMQLGGVVGVAAVARSQKKKQAAAEIHTDTGIGAQLGGNRHVLGLTAKRLLVWGHSQLSGKPKELELAIPLDDLVSISHEKGKLTTKMIFEFSDGSGAIVEAPKLTDPDTFIEAYRRLAG